MLNILKLQSRKGSSWAEEKYSKLIHISQEATIIGVPLAALSFKITSSIRFIYAFEKEINNLLKEIESLINSTSFPDQIKKNIELVDSITGI